MNVLQLHSRRLLQATAAASSPTGNDDNTDPNNFDINTHFSPSMAIILVVLLSAFFFMGFFSIYVKRCATRQDDEARTHVGAPPQPPTAQTQGVDASFLESLPLVTYSSSKKKGSNVECVVCLTDFNEGEPLCQLPRCKHVFHKECIDMWLYSHTTCPLCRRSVLSDGSRSFRWGGSGSLRLSLARRGSGRGSTAGPSTPVEGHGSGLADVEGHGSGLVHTDANANAEFDGIRAGSFSRSHSTGHSLVKQAQSRMLMRVGTPNHSNTEDMEPKTGCLPITSPVAAFRRSRSMVAMRDDDAPAPTSAPVSIGAWMRGAGASFRRVLSVKKVSPTAGDYGTPVGLAASSSARSTFDRLDPV